MTYSIILLIAIALSLAAGILGTYWIMRKIVPGKTVDEINRLKNQRLVLVKKVIVLHRDNNELGKRNKELTFLLNDEIENGKLLKAANEEMKKEYFSENRTN